jgi:hypothetical protein
MGGLIIIPQFMEQDCRISETKLLGELSSSASERAGSS